MKILFITQEDPIYVGEFWNEFSNNIESLSKEIKISGMVSLAPIGKSSKIDLLKRVYNLYGFTGTFKIGTKYLNSIILRKGLKYYCNKMGIDYITTTDIHSSEFINFASDQDLIISVSASKIFKKALIEAPKFGIANIHSGPLPYYKGMMPVFWQMRDGKKEIGITIHKVNEKIDSGDIYLQKFFDIRPIKKLDEVIRYTKREGAKLVIDFLNNFQRYYNNPREMKGKGSYFSFPTRKDTIEFKEKGFKLI